ncbi:MAG: PASTA domain-containing protein [Bifidobacteriaceae bacterium]|nr:PASTA domain-containing protein [Bifidobacteriaceae bacterium]
MNPVTSQTPQNPVAPQHDPAADDLIDGRYSVRRRIADGGMATVYEAQDVRLDRTVALKIMHTQLAQGPNRESFIRHFRREAQSAARIASPHVVQVYDFGQWHGLDFLVMEYVDGCNLRHVLHERGRFTIDQTLHVVGETLEGLTAAHREGVVHRDIKPENILINARGHVQITDFGLAKAASQATMATTGMLLGTAAYLAPEMIESNLATPQGDLYSVGIMAWELLCGVVPFNCDNSMTMVFKHVNEDVPDLASVYPDVPAPVNDFVRHLTMRDMAKRPADASVALEEFQAMRSKLTEQQLAWRAADTPSAQKAAGATGAKPALEQVAQRAMSSAAASGDEEETRAGNLATPGNADNTSNTGDAGIAGDADNTVSTANNGDVGSPAASADSIDSSVCVSPSATGQPLADHIDGSQSPHPDALQSAAINPQTGDITTVSAATAATNAAPALPADAESSGTAVPQGMTARDMTAGATSASATAADAAATETAASPSDDAAIDPTAIDSAVINPAAIWASDTSDATVPLTRHDELNATSVLPQDDSPTMAIRTPAPPLPPAGSQTARTARTEPLNQSAAENQAVGAHQPAGMASTTAIAAGNAIPGNDGHTGNAATQVVSLKATASRRPAKPHRATRKLVLTVLLVLILLAGCSAIWWFFSGPGSYHELPAAQDVTCEDSTSCTVTNAKWDDYRQLLDDAGIDYQVTQRNDDAVARGNIISTSPSLVGSHVSIRGGIVDVVVSEGPAQLTIPSDLLDASTTDGKDPIAALEAAGFTNVQHDESADQYSLTVPQGAAISVTPAPGTTVDHNAAITVALSKGPKPVTFPDVIGKARTDVESELAADNLTVTWKQDYSDSVDEGKIISATAAAGDTLHWGDSVTITVSLGPQMATVPDVVGSSYDDAAKTLTDLGFSVEKKTTILGNWTDQVRQQSVQAGQSVRIRNADGTPTVITLTVV